MKILLHCCCGPCAIYPTAQLRRQGHQLRAFFYNHIHPHTEWEKRRATLADWAAAENLPLIVDERYPLLEFLRNAAFRETRRCLFCYHDRLEKTARIAHKSGYDAYTTTLLYSKFQQHDKIAELGREIGHRYGVEFYYEDFRAGWRAGIEISKARGMYRQQYCGCIYSEGERYLGKPKLYAHSASGDPLQA
ncbi:MAG: epoxyqueuosine reductase QueH [Deltaproteobacteria bacterium]|nr:epoxyqueuosine reductase QueH [Deltaproteobacteria bacterium]